MSQLDRPFILFENSKPSDLFGACGGGPGGFSNIRKPGNVATLLVMTER